MSQEKRKLDEKVLERKVSSKTHSNNWLGSSFTKLDQHNTGVEVFAFHMQWCDSSELVNSGTLSRADIPGDSVELANLLNQKHSLPKQERRARPGRGKS
ncbi:hypothetical protein PoB_001197700 [Plakobranchus ocellatus]|uniref:Uncharacterized protein n=1 Tax=Plakobranchus ocellatus TaxID=259542 RepID=A0AAV3YRB1_9GAST|nr:hypothetical protein PoB_001197700 [Plakobranchus ocellatus]